MALNQKPYLRELCSKFSSLFYSEFPPKLFHYAYYYSQDDSHYSQVYCHILQLFFTFAIKKVANYTID